jgi:hypothetical protein
MVRTRRKAHFTDACFTGARLPVDFAEMVDTTWKGLSTCLRRDRLRRARQSYKYSFEHKV